MKTIVSRAALVFLGMGCMISTFAYAKNDAKLETIDQKLSYSMGYQVGGSFKDNKDMKLDLDLFLRGISDRLKDQTPAMSDEDMKQAMSSFQQKIMTQRDEENKHLTEKNKKESETFLRENKAKKGIVTLPSGLQYEELKPGTGAIPADDDTVSAHYRATLIDGKEFANTYTKNEPAKFSPKIVIPGWREALLKMKEGAKWRLFIPPELAYGEKGAPPILGPNVVAIFEVELLSVTKADKADKKDSADADASKSTQKPKSANKPAKNPKAP